MGGKHCCYGTCNSDSRYVAKRPEMLGVFFIPFPKPKTNLEKCKLWIKQCGRKDFGLERINKDTYICSKHFVGGKGPTAEHPHPIPAAVTELEQRIASKPVRPPPRKRSLETLPPPSSPKRNRSTQEIGEIQDAPMDVPIYNFADRGCQTHWGQQYSRESPLCAAVDEVTQTSISYTDMKCYSTDELQDSTLLQRNKFVDRVKSSDKSCIFYTGLKVAMLVFIFDFLRDKASRMRYWKGACTPQPSPARAENYRPRVLTLFEEFLLTLVRLRRGWTTLGIADVFGISKSLASNIFTTWINFLDLELKPLLIRWPSREQVLKHLPKSFKHFKKTRAIIDCTEIFVAKPSIPSSQRITWSNYKHHNTLKLLVATSPRGTFIFLSELWTGSVSDKRITAESGFLDKIEHGDDIMADRGFLIRDLLAEKGATLNIPPFAQGKQLTSWATTKTRRIASARIHVERAIGRLKTFRLLNGTISLDLKPLLNQIVGVCAALCNLQKPLNA